MKKLTTLFVFIAAVCALVALPVNKASADTVNYNNVIDDVVFDDTSTMNAAAIDAFLNTFPNSCISTNRGFAAPDPIGYNPTQGFLFGSNVSAGTVVYHAAQAFDMNPQVLIATMQKEQSLVTGSAGCYPNTPDKNASYPCNLYNNGKTYNCTGACPYGGGCIPIAVGYGCPGKCNADQEGFSQQIIRAAWRMSFDRHRAEGQADWYINKPNWDNSDDLQSCYNGPMTQGTWRICPSGAASYYDGYYTTLDPAVVHIDNGATAALYHYTPFQHGQSLFFNTFTNWFGSTHASVSVSSPLTMASSLREGTFTGQNLTFSFAIDNTTNYPQDIGTMAIACRTSGGANCDFGNKDITVPANSRYTYVATTNIVSEDTYTFSITNYKNGTWSDSYPESNNISNSRVVANKFVQAMPTISIPPTSDVADMRVGKTANLSFGVKNNSSQSIDVGKLALAMRDPSGANADLPLVAPGSLAAGAQYVYTQPFTPGKQGTYSGTIVDTKDNGATWNGATFPALAAGVQRTILLTTKPGITTTQSIQSTNTTPRVGQTATLSFKVKNWGDSSVDLGEVGLGGRDPQGYNVDPGIMSLVLAPGEERTISFTVTFTKVGTYNYFVLSTPDNGRTWSNGPVGESGGIEKKLSFNVLP